jgi:hypothetical protein
VAFKELENKSVNQILAGTLKNVREGVTYSEADAKKEPTPSPYIQACITSVTKALKQAGRSQKDAVIKAIREEVQQIMDICAIALVRLESLNVEDRKMTSLHTY